MILVQNALDPVEISENFTDGFPICIGGKMHVSNLMIANGKRLAPMDIEEISVGGDLDVEFSPSCQFPVDEYWTIYFFDAVFRKHHQIGTLSARCIQQSPQFRVQFSPGSIGLGRIGAMTLVVIIKMRQVDHQKVGILLLYHLERCIDNPARRADPCKGSPEFEQWKAAKTFLHIDRKICRFAVEKFVTSTNSKTSC